jgi:hypothetical protein
MRSSNLAAAAAEYESGMTPWVGDNWWVPAVSLSGWERLQRGLVVACWASWAGWAAVCAGWQAGALAAQSS